MSVSARVSSTVDEGRRYSFGWLPLQLVHEDDDEWEIDGEETAMAQNKWLFAVHIMLFHTLQFI